MKIILHIYPIKNFYVFDLWVSPPINSDFSLFGSSTKPTKTWSGQMLAIVRKHTLPQQEIKYVVIHVTLADGTYVLFGWINPHPGPYAGSYGPKEKQTFSKVGPKPKVGAVTNWEADTNWDWLAQDSPDAICGPKEEPTFFKVGSPQDADCDPLADDDADR